MRKQVLHPRTAAINQKQKNKSKKARLDALHWLASTFPDVFDNRISIRPLCLGIMDDILKHADKALAAGISKSKLREAVVLYTRRLDYLACLKTREMRVDLHGHVTEPVTEEDAEKAAAKIRKRVEKSIKNTRKSMPSTIAMADKTKSKPVAQSLLSGQNNPLYHSESVLTYPMQNHVPHQPAKAANVTIKHKQARQYDPDAIARLKAKLGLSPRLEEKEATE